MHSQKLVLCEKPSQARDIANILGAKNRQYGFIEGNGYQVTWCLGHLLTLSPPEQYKEGIKPWRVSVLPVIPDQWRLVPNKKTSKQLFIVKKLLKSTNHVILATDADREGDLIGREVLNYCNYQGKIERLWLSALDDQSIKRAFVDIKPNSFSEKLYDAGLGRQRADWLIGMNMTMATTSIFSHGQGVLSVGRVQSPTLKLIVDRDRKIENFKPKDYFDLNISVTKSEKGASAFYAKWMVPDEFSDESGRCMSHESAKALASKLSGANLEVTYYHEEEKLQNPPLGLSLSILQKLASNKFGFSAKETLEIAQTLYETYKAITYPRTDCQYLPESQKDDVERIITFMSQKHSYLEILKQADLGYVSPIWNDKKITAHHAIIPTLNEKVAIDSMNAKESKIYDLVCRYYLAQFLGKYGYVQKEVELTYGDERFKSNAHIPKTMGWKLAIKESEKEATSNKEQKCQDIPILEVGEIVKCIDFAIETKQTKPPAYFTEGTLITAMKNIAKYLDNDGAKTILKKVSGIGTEATRANIIEILIQRQYVERKKKHIISTEKGRALIDLLPDVVINPLLTAEWESQLNDIAQGKGRLDDFMDAQGIRLDEMLTAIKAKGNASLSNLESIFKCPDCEKPLIKRRGKYGLFWGCSGYPECKNKFKDIKGKPMIEEKKYLCHHCDGYLKLRKSNHGKFWGCANYPACRTAIEDKGGKPAGWQVDD